MQGTYQFSTIVNKEQSWISNENNKAVWYNSEKNIWLIGSKDKIGGDIGSFYARGIPGSGQSYISGPCMPGLELARMPRVNGTRRISEHHLRHLRILRFLILTGALRIRPHSM